ncbi:MAG: hypothetical protein WDO68_28220 [Gammaproteobacteria bacterium]
MSVNAQQVLEDLVRVLGDIDEWVKASATASADGKAAAADPELERKLVAIRARIDGVKDLIARQVHQRVEAVDSYFRANTWKTVGIAAGVAFIAGLAIGRPSRSSKS